MSNRVPVMSPEHFPYYFWYPEAALGFGDYFGLYNELCLLPDVAIAEEARDSKAGQAIYEAIMKGPVQYAYMDDYNCCLRLHPLASAYLNRDTCVHSTLDKKQSLGLYGDSPLLTEVVIDITEDCCIDINGVIPYVRPVDPHAVALLSSPLPADLPTVDKDLLTLMAAWSGNIN
ncbi:hypothetical protein BDW59DRAFT_160410 [Aspergillus cavernicola]|uniref:Uncharacterized protein n=1 Tax=Aspergillus cavernicola TaxID=176166 RepID=A0ABR4IH74_9EURO